MRGLRAITFPKFAVLGIVLVLIGGGVAAHADSSANGTLKPRPELLVKTAWLAANLKAPDMRIVDLREPEAFAEGHIPGAVNFPPYGLFVSVAGVPGMLPPARQVAIKLGELGVGAGTKVVAYDDANGLYAARLFWALDFIGQGGGHLLDGGWPLWAREGRPITREAPNMTPRTLAPKVRTEVLADLEWMRSKLKDRDTVFVDARSAMEYSGVSRHAKHRGHIPGAVSMEWKNHLNPDGTLRSAQALTEAFRDLGVTADKEVAVYCQVMVRAAHSYFTLKWLGFPRVRAYDGSWAEWGNRDNTPKETF